MDTAKIDRWRKGAELAAILFIKESALLANEFKRISARYQELLHRAKVRQLRKEVAK